VGIVRWIGHDLWLEGFVEQVYFKSGMEEREEVMDGVTVVTDGE